MDETTIDRAAMGRLAKALEFMILGTQIAAANFDLSGTTKLGTRLIDHSFFIPMLVMSVVTIAVGAFIGGVFF